MENLFVYIAIIAPFLPFLFFILNWKKVKSVKPLWVIIAYALLIDFLVNLIMGFAQHHPLKSALYACFTFFEYLFFTYYLYLHIKNEKFRRFMLVASVLFSLFIIIYYLTVKFSVIDSVPIGIETILILIYSFYYLYTEMNDTTTLFIYNKSVFWVILGMVLYLAGSFFIYIAANSFPKEEIEKFWSVTNVLSLAKHIFFCIAILVHSKPNKDDTKYSLELSSLN